MKYRVTVDRLRQQFQSQNFEVEADSPEEAADKATAIFQRAMEDSYTGRTPWKYRAHEAQPVR